jgi:myosin heavy subunit
MAEQYKFPDELDDNKSEKVEILQPEDDVEIEIVDDTPVQDRGRRPLDKEVEDPTDDEIENYSDKVKVRIKELTHARHDERRAKEALYREKQELERLAQHMVEENKRLKQHVNSGSEQYGAMAKTAAEAEMDKARREYKAAQESFDTDAILAAQESLFDAKAKLQQAQNFRPAPLQVEEYDVQPQQPVPQQVQPDEKTLRWQAKNQWFGAQGFEEVSSFALGLHQKLVSNGVDPRSDEYFEQIDARVKSTFPEMFGGTSEKPRRPSSVVAPATRSTGTRKVQLTPSQAALIKKYNLDPKKYVAEVLKLENQNG